jgi:hypothetical protein
MNNPIEMKEHKGYTIKMFNDNDPESPRYWDNLGTMICFHRRYNLGDEHKYKRISDFLEDIVSEYEKISEGPYSLKFDKYCISLPLYLYDHSGITINTTGFSCPWDSGQVGIIYVSLTKIREEYEVKRVSKKLRNTVADLLRNEVDTYDKYLKGEVYGYIVEKQGEQVDSCWGYYSVEEAMQAAESAADYDWERTKPHYEQLPLPL